MPPKLSRSKSHQKSSKHEPSVLSLGCALEVLLKFLPRQISESWSQDDAQKDLDEALPALDAAVRYQDAKKLFRFWKTLDLYDSLMILNDYLIWFRFLSFCFFPHHLWLLLCHYGDNNYVLPIFCLSKVACLKKLKTTHIQEAGCLDGWIPAGRKLECKSTAVQVKALPNPPGGVRLACEAICVMPLSQRRFLSWFQQSIEYHLHILVFVIEVSTETSAALRESCLCEILPR